MPRLRVARSVWLDRARSDRSWRFPRLRSDLQVDVAIIGGGVTGAATAWRFASAGLRVALLEAGRIGGGSTAASTALLMQEPDEDFAVLSSKYGAASARRIWRLSLDATHELVETVRRLRIECELVRRDSVYYAQTTRHADRLRDEHERRAAAGFRGRWLDTRAVRRVAGIDAAGAIRTHGNAQVDPVAACIGLLRAAVSRGARVFEHSPVGATRPAAKHVVVETDRGVIRADRVIVATGYATPYFKPLEARFRMMNTYVVGTRPLTTSERRQLGLSRVMLWDTGRPYFYARWTSDHRLLLGGADRRRIPEERRGSALAEGSRAIVEYFSSLYPILADVEIDYRWEGLFAATPDGLPYVGPHRRYPRHLFALGYGGNGMTLGFLASKLLLDYYRHGSSPDQALFGFTR
jgi:glycine/D-amino acid oxidase-like deaminating enzyme